MDGEFDPAKETIRQKIFKILLEEVNKNCDSTKIKEFFTDVVKTSTGTNCIVFCF